MVPRAGGVRVSVATRRRLRAAGAAGPRSSGRAPARGGPARRALGGGSGQRLGLGSGCRGGGRGAGGSGASERTEGAVSTCCCFIGPREPPPVTSRAGRGWRRQEVTTPKPGRQTAARRKWESEPCQRGEKLSHSCSKLVSCAWELTAQSPSVTGPEKTSAWTLMLAG